MAKQFPSSKDVTLEIDGKTIAIVQSYNTSYSRDNKEVDAFGEEDPVGMVTGKKKFTIKVARAYIQKTQADDGIDFYSIKNFDFVIHKPDRKIVYSGCIIEGVDEDGTLNDVIIEHASIRATTRREDAL